MQRWWYFCRILGGVHYADVPESKPKKIPPKDSEINPSPEYAAAIGLTKIPQDTRQILDKLFEEGKVWRSEPNATSMLFEGNYHDWQEDYRTAQINMKQINSNNEDWVSKGGWTTYLLDTTLDYSGRDFRIYGAFERTVHNYGYLHSQASGLSIDDFFTRDIFHVVTLSNESTEMKHGKYIQDPNNPNYDPNYTPDNNYQFMKLINPGTKIDYSDNIFMVPWIAERNGHNVGESYSAKANVQSIVFSISPDGGLASIIVNRETSYNGKNWDLEYAFGNKTYFSDENQDHLVHADEISQLKTNPCWRPVQGVIFPLTKK